MWECKGPNCSLFGLHIVSYKLCGTHSVHPLTYGLMSPSGVTIGFEQTTYTVEEGLVVEVCVLVTSGTLEREATVTLSSINAAAAGKSWVSMNCAWYHYSPSLLSSTWRL